MNHFKSLAAIAALFLFIGAVEPKKVVKERVGVLLDDIGSLHAQTIKHSNDAILNLASINKQLIASMNQLVASSGFFAVHDKVKLAECRNQIQKLHDQVNHVAQSVQLLEQELGASFWCAVK